MAPTPREREDLLRRDPAIDVARSALFYREVFDDAVGEVDSVAATIDAVMAHGGELVDRFPSSLALLRHIPFSIPCSPRRRV